MTKPIISSFDKLEDIKKITKFFQKYPFNEAKKEINQGKIVTCANLGKKTNSRWKFVQQFGLKSKIFVKSQNVGLKSQISFKNKNFGEQSKFR